MTAAMAAQQGDDGSRSDSGSGTVAAAQVMAVQARQWLKARAFALAGAQMAGEEKNMK